MQRSGRDAACVRGWAGAVSRGDADRAVQHPNAATRDLKKQNAIKSPRASIYQYVAELWQQETQAERPRRLNSCDGAHARHKKLIIPPREHRGAGADPGAAAHRGCIVQCGTQHGMSACAGGDG